MDDDFLARVSRAYAEHPLSAANILARVLRQKGSLDGLTELDLAVDDETMVTDQNHAGGAEAVLAASIFHFGQITIEQVKSELAGRGLEIRR